MNKKDKHKIQGLALICDMNGKVSSVLRNDLASKDSNPMGKLLPVLLSPQSRSACMNFLLEIKQKNVAFDYRLNVQVNAHAFELYFIGILLKDQILVVGAKNHIEAIEFTEHLQQINKEQTNLIRELTKVKVENEKRVDESKELFDEITKLNNELINVQRELSRKNTELKRLNELKNRFLGMAAHDMRNPLNVITAYADYLKEETEGILNEEHISFINTIYNSAYFMFQLIEDILDISKIESGKLQLNIYASDIVQLVRENIVRNNAIAGKKNISIDLSTNIEQLVILFDRQKFEQVMNNIISNAIKFSYPDSIIEVRLEQKDHQLALEVKDHGKGIKAENHEKVFLPFQKISRKGTGGEKGTGLGMSIVKQIVEGHGGKIWFESQEENKDKGMKGETTFFVRIPIKTKQ